MTYCHDQGSLKELFNLGLQFQSSKVQVHHGREHDGRQAGLTDAAAVSESLHPSPQTGSGGDMLYNLLGCHWSCCIVENDIEMMTLLPPSPEC